MTKKSSLNKMSTPTTAQNQPTPISFTTAYMGGYTDFSDKGQVSPSGVTIKSDKLFKNYECHEFCNTKIHLGKAYKDGKTFKFCPKCLTEVQKSQIKEIAQLD